MVELHVFVCSHAAEPHGVWYPLGRTVAGSSVVGPSKEFDSNVRTGLA